MTNLLKVEFYKLKRFWIGYIVMLFMFGVGYVYGDNRIGNRVFRMADNTTKEFSATVSDTSFVFLIAITAALFIGRDFSNRTIGNEIKLGYSRPHILLSRMLAAGAFSILLHVIYIVSALIGFSVVRGFDTSLFSLENFLWLLTVLLQLSAIIGGVVLIAFLVKKVSEAIALSALYAAVCCNILRNFFSTKIFTLSCFCFARDSDLRTLAAAAVSAGVTLLVFLSIAVFAFRKAEIK